MKKSNQQERVLGRILAQKFDATVSDASGGWGKLTIVKVDQGSSETTGGGGSTGGGGGSEIGETGTKVTGQYPPDQQ